MGSQWTNKYAILRDLSVAQGRKVPAEIVGSVAIGQKPPSITIKEDTEEEFFRSYAGDGDFYAKPDLGLIKEMINMVRESDPIDDDNINKVVEISKLNPLSKEFLPKVADTKNKDTNGVGSKQDVINKEVVEQNNVDTKQSVKPGKKRRQRNVALISLLEKEQSSLTQVSPTDVKNWNSKNQIYENESELMHEKQNLENKLLKPADFIVDPNITQSVEKVTEWLHKPADPQVETTKSINFLPKNMFQKKKPLTLSYESSCMFKRKSDASSIKSSDSDMVARQADNVFVPSNHANEYYKKFVERRQVQDKAQEDIWKRAERLMKEIDAKRLKENDQRHAELLDTNPEMYANLEEDGDTTKNDVKPSLPLNVPGLDIPAVRISILLEQHRHDLPEKCKVCIALAKYKRQTTSTTSSTSTSAQPKPDSEDQSQ